MSREVCGINSDFVSVATTLGADLGLYKPFDADQLILVVRTLLDSPGAEPDLVVGANSLVENCNAVDSLGESAETVAR